MRIFLLFAVYALCVVGLNTTANTAPADHQQNRIAGTPTGEDMIIFTANQDWLSRIYLLNLDGSVYTYFEYDFFRFVDMEVVDNEVYVADAFAPRVYKLDLSTGSPDLIIDDWSLYYFYGLAFDGSYFYVDEWDLNRYDINGDKDGVASFDQTVFGSAWDGTYLRTLGDDSLVRCWDVSGWPNMVEVPANSFTPPSGACRGLWFDGRNYWSAESLDGVLGKIYVFDNVGTVVTQFDEPAFNGWGACMVKGNRPPSAPDQPSPGDSTHHVATDVTLTWNASDPDGDTLLFDIYLDNSHPLELVSSQQSAAGYLHPGGFDPSTTYFWQVVAWDDHGASATGQEWTFTTACCRYGGDIDHSGGTPDISDLVHLVDYMFADGPEPPCLEEADVDGSGGPSPVDISDLVYLVDYMFSGGPEPAECP